MRGRGWSKSKRKEGQRQPFDVSTKGKEVRGREGKLSEREEEGSREKRMGGGGAQRSKQIDRGCLMPSDRAEQIPEESTQF